MSKKIQLHVGIRTPQVQNATEPDLELHFLDGIYDSFDWWTGDYTNMVKNVIDQVQGSKPKKIKLVVNSQGGDASIGLAIYNFLSNYSCKKETEVIGMAGSIASVMAMVADPGKLKMARNSFMVIHRAWGGAVGTSDELRAAADVVDKFTAQVVDVYVQRTKKTKEEVQDLIAAGDFWMTAAEAKELGFCDEVIADNNEFQVAACVQSLSQEYRNIPSNLKAEQPTNNTIFQTLQSEIMNIKSLVSNFITGLKGGTTPEAKPADPKAEVKPGEEQKPAAENEQGSVFATLIEAPLTAFLTELQKEVTNTISKDNATFKASVLNLLKEDKDFRAEVSNLVKDTEEVKNLAEQIKNLDGGESDADKNEKGKGTQNEVKFGRFV
jgi:ATP-dependent Clp endopeptidase proteolytic subunit ClpP